MKTVPFSFKLTTIQNKLNKFWRFNIILTLHLTENSFLLKYFIQKINLLKTQAVQSPEQNMKWAKGIAIRLSILNWEVVSFALQFNLLRFIFSLDKILCTMNYCAVNGTQVYYWKTLHWAWFYYNKYSRIFSQRIICAMCIVHCTTWNWIVQTRKNLLSSFRVHSKYVTPHKLQFMALLKC